MRKTLYFCICLLLLASCSTKKNDNEANPKPTSNTKQYTTRNVTYKENTRKTEVTKADHLASIASNIPGVRDATAVVLGKYSIVGIDVGAKLDRTRVETIKYSVAESLKHDPQGSNAVVVADLDTYELAKEFSMNLRPS